MRPFRIKKYTIAALAIFFSIVNLIAQAPTDIVLSSEDVDENEISGTVVGNLSTTDADVGDTHTYSLVAGDGDTDNALFTISGAELQIAAVLDHETSATRNVRIETDDGNGGTYEEARALTVAERYDELLERIHALFQRVQSLLDLLRAVVMHMLAAEQAQAHTAGGKRQARTKSHERECFGQRSHRRLLSLEDFCPRK